MQDASLAARLIQTALQNQVNVELLRRLPTLGLTDCWLVAGCIFQALWNAQADRDAAAGVKDYDIFYFDSADLSYEAEDRIGEAVEIDAAYVRERLAGLAGNTDLSKYIL